ncbi:MAG: carboxypeptidase-like regulatory domain-containing protein [Candidatus Acidiferrales bacterium]
MTVNATKKESRKNSLGRNVRIPVLGIGSLVWLSVSVLLCGFPALAQSQQPPSVPGAESGRSDAPATAAPGTAASAGAQQSDQQLSGTICGTVVDGTGAAVAGSHVKLTRDGQTTVQDVVSGENGQFCVANIAPGSFQLTVTSEGFATQTFSGVLHSGEFDIVPQITLSIAGNVTVVRVGLTRTEVAEAQIKEEEKQRVLGFMPNFYVSYLPDAVPLTPRQKFELAWKTTVNPFSFGIVGAIAGIQQAENSFSGYGQGAEGYGKRYGAAYADFAAGTFIGSALLPSLLKQDPRYFYKGTGSKRSRIFYAMANAVICKGDNGHWEPNYSNVLGSLAAGGISNLYYPGNDRGAELTFENALIGIGATAGANVLQEFIVRKLTPHLPDHSSAKTPSTSTGPG